jgi:hypothetical protein
MPDSPLKACRATIQVADWAYSPVNPTDATTLHVNNVRQLARIAISTARVQLRLMLETTRERREA